MKNRDELRFHLTEKVMTSGGKGRIVEFDNHDTQFNVLVFHSSGKRVWYPQEDIESFEDT